ncbi:hypothetical protein NLG07_00490 [Alteromonas sp. LMIT006]|uniref:hypothetical protein n=1 Tax=Alteromonadaceae TaxID=72275 RepID=UPI0020CA7AB7|nr:hypothetical protein [Alteromonas sp. LMIT006]UTP72751.1 hypothetical protein NLG07_00490 [Alteromonas sp. LMIT006]
MSNYIDFTLNIKCSTKESLMCMTCILCGNQHIAQISENEFEHIPKNPNNDNSYKYLNWENFGVCEIFSTTSCDDKIILSAGFRSNASRVESETMDEFFKSILSVDKSASIELNWFYSSQTPHYGKQVANRDDDIVVVKEITIKDIEYKDFDHAYDDSWVSANKIEDILIEKGIPEEKIKYVDGSLSVRKLLIN